MGLVKWCWSVFEVEAEVQIRKISSRECLWMEGNWKLQGREVLTYVVMLPPSACGINLALHVYSVLGNSVFIHD